MGTGWGRVVGSPHHAHVPCTVPLIAAPGGTCPSSPTISRPTASSPTAATCTRCSRSAPSSGRSSWRWGEHWPGGGASPGLGHRQGSQTLFPTRFTEMPTDNYIESSFWNFDALFQPQQHPARDQHDTFFLRGGWALRPRATRGPGPGQSLSGQPIILQDKLHPPQGGQQSLCELLSSTSVIFHHLPSSHLGAFALSAFCREVSSPGLHGRLWYQISPHMSP